LVRKFKGGGRGQNELAYVLEEGVQAKIIRIVSCWRVTDGL